MDILRNASTISDEEFIRAIAKLRKPHAVATRSYGYYYVIVGELAEELQIHDNRIRSKLRRTYNRGLVDGCSCGCRGDISLTFEGEAFLRRIETNSQGEN